MNLPSKYFEEELLPKLKILKENITYTEANKTNLYIYATTKKYRYHTEMWLPKNPINLDALTDPRLVEKRSKNRGKSLHRDVNIINSVRRTRQSIFGYAAMNPFMYFLTLTQNCSNCVWKCAQKPCSVAGVHKKADCNTTRCDCPPMFCDRYNLELFEKRITTWLKHMKARKYPDLEFLLVFEKHKSGAFHAHALILGYDGEMLPATDHFTLKPTIRSNRPVFNMPGWKFGYSTAKIIGQSKEDSKNTAGYLAKYITKETITDLNKHRYKASRGLVKPLKGRNPDYINLDDLSAIDSAYESEYGIKFQLDNEKL